MRKRLTALPIVSILWSLANGHWQTPLPHYGAAIVPGCLSRSRIWYDPSEEVTMIELTDEQASVLKQGYPVRVPVPGLGGDIIIVLAAPRESTESVLQETLDEIREKAALSKLGRQAAVSWLRENPYG